MALTLPRKVLLSIIGVSALFIIAVVLTAGILIRSAYKTAFEHAEARIVQFAADAESGLNRSLLGVDVLLATVDDLLQLSSTVTKKIKPHQASELMRSRIDQNLLVHYVALLTPEGKVLASSDRSGSELKVVLPEGFIRQVLEQPIFTVFISTPHTSSNNPEPALFFGRTVSLADGSRVITVAQVPLQLLANIMQQDVAGSALELTLQRIDGQLLLSVPQTSAPVAGIVIEKLEELLASGTVQKLPSILNGAPTLMLARRTLYRSTWISVAMPIEVALAQWRIERNFIVAVSMMALPMIVFAAVFARWYLLRMERANGQLAQSKTVIDQALNSMDSGFLLLDSGGRILTWNRRFEEIFPSMRVILKPQLYYPQTFEAEALDIFPDGDITARGAWVQNRMKHFGSVDAEHEQHYPDGREIHISERQTPDGGRVCIYQDVTEERKAQMDQRIAATAFESQEGMSVTDANGTYLRINKAFTKITGYNSAEVIGKSPNILKSGRHDASFYATIWESIHNTGAWEGEIWNRRKNGEIYPEHLTITAVKNSDKVVTNYVSTLTDITLTKAAEDEIKNLAFYDPLTRLPNRRLLLDRLRHALASIVRSGRSGALLFIDLDNFKSLNDTHGHAIGDLLLKQVAIRLGSCVREGDTVARLGGDEFVVMLEELSKDTLEAGEQTELVGNKILISLNQPYQLASHEHHSTPSIGVTLFNDNYQSIDELMKQADIAMYQSKKAGRNTLHFFDPKMQEIIDTRATLERELRDALTKNQFQLHFQLQVGYIKENGNHRPLGAEALIRWIHPDRGVISPAEFIPLAEESGLIIPIGQWVLNTACAQIKEWAKGAVTQNLHLAVNVSAKQFRQASFVRQVKETVQRHGINPKLLKLELTESMLLED
jgi:diguanylate cyclase (GGDEF)-like protein/PAS domain S-box-containing protein